MRSVALWMARQFDGRLTLAGALIALLLMGTGIGALIGLASGSTVALALLGVPFLLLLCLALLAAHYTDPTLRLSEHEKRERWEKVPKFLRRSLYVFGASALAGVMLDGRLGHLVSWSLIAISSMLFAEGVRRERPPLPRTKGGLVTEGESPSEYKRLWRQTLWGFYSCGAASLLFALLSLR